MLRALVRRCGRSEQQRGLRIASGYDSSFRGSLSTHLSRRISSVRQSSTGAMARTETTGYLWDERYNFHDTGTNVSAENAAFHPKFGIFNQVWAKARPLRC